MPTNFNTLEADSTFPILTLSQAKKFTISAITTLNFLFYNSYQLDAYFMCKAKIPT